jgi:hypothetical protein
LVAENSKIGFSPVESKEDVENVQDALLSSTDVYFYRKYDKEWETVGFIETLNENSGKPTHIVRFFDRRPIDPNEPGYFLNYRELGPVVEKYILVVAVAESDTRIFLTDSFSTQPSPPSSVGRLTELIKFELIINDSVTD